MSTASILAASEVAANGIAIDDAIASYRRNLRAENKSPNTIHTYLAALNAFNAYLKLARRRRRPRFDSGRQQRITEPITHDPPRREAQRSRPEAWKEGERQHEKISVE